MALYGPYSYRLFFHIFVLLELLCDGAVKAVTARNCYILIKHASLIIL